MKAHNKQADIVSGYLLR